VHDLWQTKTLRYPFSCSVIVLICTSLKRNKFQLIWVTILNDFFALLVANVLKLGLLDINCYVTDNTGINLYKFLFKFSLEEMIV
jgi:hypothetical protein